jgi:hypothetical protein
MNRFLKGSLSKPADRVVRCAKDASKPCRFHGTAKGRGRSGFDRSIPKPEGDTMTTAVLAYFYEKRDALAVDWTLVAAACFGMTLAAIALV